jgi:hypothetical protein
MNTITEGAYAREFVPKKKLNQGILEMEKYQVPTLYFRSMQKISMRQLD